MAVDAVPPEDRRDIVPTRSASLSRRLERAAEARAAILPPGARGARRDTAKDDRRFGLRTNLLEPRRSDPYGFERVIGASDLMSINFLDRGRRAAAAVCRIKVSSDGGPWYGTAFLVGPRLLLTNHHVLGNADEASQAEAEFGYEHDLDGALGEPVSFNLNPGEIFYSDPVLDITFVAVTPYSSANVPLTRYGWLPLLPLSGKAVDGEWVSIIQHPGGQPKQIAIRASNVITLAPGEPENPTADAADNFIHYSTDTEPGSSGAPVLNDQWQVLAVHHKAVPSVETLDRPAAEQVWIANEGVRISAIFRHLEEQRLRSRQTALVLDRLERALGFAPQAQTAPLADGAFEADRKPLPLSRWRDVTGYDPRFLSQSIDLAAIYAPALARGLVAPLRDGKGHELTYRHFSCVIHKERKFALLTAVNIDGNRLARPGERGGWRQDARIDPEYQPDGAFYERNRGGDPVVFSRGHLVRFLDPCWGPEAPQAGEDTMHYTNAAPQVQRYNDTDWGNLEDYILDKAQTTERKLTVFTGPIYRDNDPLYGEDREGGPWRIPLSYWKIAVLQKTRTQVAAAAFIVGQTQYVQALYEARVFSGLKPYTVDEMRERQIQTTITAVEEETGLDFAVLKPYDAHGSLEATRQTRWLHDPGDILI